MKKENNVESNSSTRITMPWGTLEKFVGIKLWRNSIKRFMKNTGYYMEQEFCMTRLDLVEESTQSV